MEQQLTIDPNKVRALDPGMAYLISHGRAMKIQIPRAPALSIPLPVPPSQTPSKDAPDVPVVHRSSAGVVDLPF
jgi:hypothetical protein